MNATAKFCQRAIAYVKVPAPETPDEVALSEADSPVLKDLENGLLVAYLVDEDGSFTYVQHRHVTDAGISLAQLHDFGITNLRQIAEERLRVQEYGSVYAVFLEGNFEASLILLDSLWTEGLAHLVKNGFAAAIPARDILAFCDSSSTEGLAELRQIVSRAENGDHPLTPVLYRRDQGCWTRYAA